jgi:hypothetical protein
MYINLENFSAAVLVSLIIKTPQIKKKSHEMKLRLQNYAVIIPTVKSCIKFNKNRKLKQFTNV